MRYSLIISFLLICNVVFAPDIRPGLILVSDGIDPYERIAFAMGKVESNNNPLAFNRKEMATGYFQVRPVRLLDYNQRTGDSLTMKDMFNYEKSYKVWKYYAVQSGFRNLELIAKNWNCGSVKYWDKVKRFL